MNRRKGPANISLCRTATVLLLVGGCSAPEIRGTVSVARDGVATPLAGVEVLLVPRSDSLALQVQEYCERTKAALDSLHDWIPQLVTTLQSAFVLLPSPDATGISPDSSQRLIDLRANLQRQGARHLADATGLRLALVSTIPDSVAGFLRAFAEGSGTTDRLGGFVFGPVPGGAHWVWSEHVSSDDRRLNWWVRVDRSGRIDLTSDNEAGDSNYCGLDYEQAGTLRGAIQVTNIIDVPDLLADLHEPQ